MAIEAFDNWKINLISTNCSLSAYFVRFYVPFGFFMAAAAFAAFLVPIGYFRLHGVSGNNKKYNLCTKTTRFQICELYFKVTNLYFL